MYIYDTMTRDNKHSVFQNVRSGEELWLLCALLLRSLSKRAETKISSPAPNIVEEVFVAILEEGRQYIERNTRIKRTRAPVHSTAGIAAGFLSEDTERSRLPRRNRRWS